jgi:hypothetical protein
MVREVQRPLSSAPDERPGIDGLPAAEDLEVQVTPRGGGAGFEAADRLPRSNRFAGANPEMFDVHV